VPQFCHNLSFFEFFFSLSYSKHPVKWMENRPDGDRHPRETVLGAKEQSPQMSARIVPGFTDTAFVKLCILYFSPSKS
jgi:hypothetical protein